MKKVGLYVRVSTQEQKTAWHLDREPVRCSAKIL